MTKAEIEGMSTPEFVERDSVLDDMLLFDISSKMKDEMTPQEVYEATRGFWDIDLDTVEDITYAVPMYRGIGLAVYEIIDWLPAGTSSYQTRKFTPEQVENQYEFIGTVVPSDLSEQFVGKSFGQLVENVAYEDILRYLYKK